MSEFGEDIGKPVAQAIGKSFAALIERLVLGIGGERFALRTANVENKKAERLLIGEIERDRIRAQAKHAANIVERMNARREELAKRAIERLSYDTAWAELNLEDILNQAKLITYEGPVEDAYSSEGQEDWLFQWFKYARDVSTPSLQQLWARVIAEQTRDRGHRISLKALDTLRFMQSNLARRFEEVVRRSIISDVSLDHEYWAHVESEVEAIEVVEELDLLEDIGLIRVSPRGTVSAGIYKLDLDFSEADLEAPGSLKEVRLSKIGEELAEVAVPGFLARRVAVSDCFKDIPTDGVRKSWSSKDRELNASIAALCETIGKLAISAVHGMGYAFEITDHNTDNEFVRLIRSRASLTWQTARTDALSPDEHRAIAVIHESVELEARSRGIALVNRKVKKQK